MPTSILAFVFLLQGAAESAAGAQGAEVEQLSRPLGTPSDLVVPNVAPAAKGTNPALVQQLPPTLDAPSEHGKGEDTLIRGDERKTLAAEVARAAELMRQRGQQPTPEALAREIGPDALAAFLDQDPSALDSYSAPKEEGTAHTPIPQGGEGAVIILPANPGS